MLQILRVIFSLEFGTLIQELRHEELAVSILCQAPDIEMAKRIRAHVRKGVQAGLHAQRVTLKVPSNGGIVFAHIVVVVSCLGVEVLSRESEVVSKPG